MDYGIWGFAGMPGGRWVKSVGSPGPSPCGAGPGPGVEVRVPGADPQGGREPSAHRKGIAGCECTVIPSAFGGLHGLLFQDFRP